MPEPTPPHIRSAFAFRVALYTLAWSACLVLSGPEAKSIFGAVVNLLALAMPFAAPLVFWFDWRWLKANADTVNRYGFRRR